MIEIEKKKKKGKRFNSFVFFSFPAKFWSSIILPKVKKVKIQFSASNNFVDTKLPRSLFISPSFIHTHSISISHTHSLSHTHTHANRLRQGGLSFQKLFIESLNFCESQRLFENLNSRQSFQKQKVKKLLKSRTIKHDSVSEGFRSC